mmetsp:Transcript_93683/g.269798  ORF Transcript_93683/g.269798 Transcript_93683/m.269798 type:complete len:960 (-) Transcript_93683:73-2952(-)
MHSDRSSGESAGYGSNGGSPSPAVIGARRSTGELAPIAATASVPVRGRGRPAARGQGDADPPPCTSSLSLPAGALEPPGVAGGSGARSPSRSRTGSSNASSRSNSLSAIPTTTLGLQRGHRSPQAESEASDVSSDTTPAGSEINRRRPSRLLDPSELAQAVGVSFGAVALNERRRSKMQVSSHEYSDSECGSPRGTAKKRAAHVAYLAPYEMQAKRQSLAKDLLLLEPSNTQAAVTWLVTVAIAVVTAMECTGIMLLSGALQNWRLDLVASAARAGGGGSTPLLLAFLPLLAYALTVTVLGALLVVVLGAPWASGSGVPDLKAFLNGNGIPGLFSFRTWIARGVGLILITSSGLFAGMEGPAAHLGAITAHGIAKFAFSARLTGGLLPPMGHRTSCEFVAQGIAIGVASAFGAPVGGVLFSFEEASSFWSKALTWRSFVGSMIAAALAKAANVGFTGLPLSGFIEFPDHDAAFEFWQLLPIALLALTTGCIGAIFAILTEHVMLARGHFYGRCTPKRRHVYHVLEVVLVTLATLLLGFWLPAGMGCRQLLDADAAAAAAAASGDGEFYVGKLRSLFCLDGEYSDIGVVLLEQKETAIKVLFTNSFEGGATFRTDSLLLAAVVVFFLTLFTHGTAIPGGLFVPNILLGCILGRATGQIAQDVSGNTCHPGVFAILGAVGMLAGYSRMTISIAMITLEITQSMKLLLPVTLTILLSKVLADALKPESVYDLCVSHHPLGRITLLQAELDEEDLPTLRLLTAHDACSVEVQTLKCEETPQHVMATLMQTRFSGFPLVASTGSNEVVGLVTRERLLQALKEHQAGGGPGGDARGQPINLLSYADQTPEVKHWNTPLVRTFRHFSSAGLRHLCLVDEAHRLVGILTRSDLAPLCHPRSRNGAVSAILRRKHAALRADDSGADDDQHAVFDGASESDTTPGDSSSERDGRTGLADYKRGSTWWLG